MAILKIFDKKKKSAVTAPTKVAEVKSEPKAHAFGSARSVLSRPLITEKMTLVTKYNQYGFVVLPSMNKNEVKKYIEKKFKVNVTKINMIKQKGKVKRLGRAVGRRSDFKKAIVTLKAGQKITIA